MVVPALRLCGSDETCIKCIVRFLAGRRCMVSMWVFPAFLSAGTSVIELVQEDGPSH